MFTLKQTINVCEADQRDGIVGVKSEDTEVTCIDNAKPHVDITNSVISSTQPIGMEIAECLTDMIVNIKEELCDTDGDLLDNCAAEVMSKTEEINQGCIELLRLRGVDNRENYEIRSGTGTAKENVCNLLNTQAKIMKATIGEGATEDYINIKQEQCDGDAEYLSTFVSCSELKVEEIDSGCGCIEHMPINTNTDDVRKSIDCCLNCAHPVAGIAVDQTKSESIVKAETIKITTDNIRIKEEPCDGDVENVDFVAHCPRDLKLKMEEIDLGCDCIEQLNSHEDNLCTKNTTVEERDVRTPDNQISGKQTQTIEVMTEECTTEMVKWRSHTDEHKCKICEKKFAKVSYLKYHMTVHSSEKPHKCTICEKKYSRAGHLKQHMQTHSGEKLHKCNICDKKFARKEHLKQHYLTHTGEKHYKCTLCDQKFSWIANLNRHMLKHTGEKLHKCTVCNKQFSQLATLNVHVSTHTSEKPHTCTFCEKKFAVKKYLNAHILTHTGEKIHKCMYCEKRFAKKIYLNNHILTHNGEKPHTCKICEKKFSLKHNLNNHILTHTGEKPHMCKFCEKKFALKSNLNQHMSKHCKKA